MSAPARCTGRVRAAIATLAGAVALAGCGDALPTSSPAGDGNPRRGAAIFVEAGCGACHTRSDLDGATGRVAPPLDDFDQRRFVAGVLPNTHDDLTRWIHAPQSVAPGSGMPDPGISERDAADVAAFLLHRR